MHRKPDATNLPEHNANSNKPNSVHSQPRWSGTRQGFILKDVLGKGRTNLNQAEHPNGGLGTKTCEPMRAEGTGDIICSTKEIPLTIVSHSDGKCGDEQPHIRQDIPIMPPTMSEYAAPPTQLQELVGHSIACPSYPYTDLYHGGVVSPYGPQSLVHPHCIGVHPARMALPLEMAEEPVYVNAKQYHGILRRRQSRAKAELEKKVIKVRKPYLHESRHLHAMRRARGCGGRFLNTKKLDTDPSSNATPAEKGGEISTSNLLSQLYLNSSSGARSNASHNVIQSANTSVGHREATEYSGRQQSGTTIRKTYSNDNGWECPRQQHERIVAHSHRALTIK